MITLSKLYQIADEENIEVDCFDLKNREAISVMDEEGFCYIAIDPYQLQSEEDERMKLAHELGHCVTGSFYNIHAAVDCRQRHENMADKWAIKKLIPKDELENAVEKGFTEIWELAEWFGINEDYIKKAICYYTNGNLATELYL